MHTQEIVGYSPAPFQLEDLQHLQSLNASANFSEMGCYKTTTALWLSQFKLQDRTSPALLIVTTKMGKGTYFDAVPKTLPSWIFLNIHTRKITRFELGGKLEMEQTPQEFIDAIKGDVPVVVLAHYHCFMNNSAMKDVLTHISWDGVILDEAHRIKNRDGQWTRNIKRLKTVEGGFKHIMTGTGFINRPDEFWSLLNFLDRASFSSYWKFRAHFCMEETDWSGFSKIVGLYPNRIEEFRELRKSIGVRRELKDVRPDIDQPIFTDIEVELNPVQRKMFNDIRDILRTLDQQGEPISSPNVLSQLNRLRQIAVATPEFIEDYYDEKLERRIQVIKLVEPSSKLDATMELIDNMAWDDESKQQVVVFSCFKDPLELLEARLQKADIPYVRLLQSMNEDERYKLWHDVWPTKEHRVFLCTLSLGGESINLTSAQHVVFLDRSWSPKDNMQAVGRVYRPGQEGQTQVIYINGIDTTDSRIINANETKISWFNAIFGQDTP